MVGWLSSYFLQLVLLAVILVGQKLQSEDSRARHHETHEALESLHMKHDLLAQSHDRLHKKHDALRKSLKDVL